MTWQLVSFVILGLALLSGFAWYERTRPDARILALVASMAAFAALGRIAFAALPNIKPTTDIVLVSGYALGGAPGFVVGALAGLTSNFFFGQGPWTPWQMAGWGATGVLGAGLAILTRGRIGRWRLALVAAVVGYAFATLQDVGDWINYSDHSLAQLGIYVGKGTGFDFVHAFGCLVFALAFGPSLTHSIQRFALRLQVTWRTLDGALLPVTVALVPLALGAGLTLAAPARAMPGPSAYLQAAQNIDGGFGPAPGSASTSLFSGWAALGLAAEGINPQDVHHGAASLVDYIRAGAGSLSDVGSLERTILVVRAAGLSATSFGSQNLIAALERNVGSDGSVSGQVNLTSFAVLALRSAAVAPPPSMLSWLARQQDRDGGFNFASGGGMSDVDDTGAALQALAGSGGFDAGARGRAVAFIDSQQSQDGGFPSQPGGEPNAQSTAWAIQGLLAVGVDPSSVHHGSGPSPLQFLRSLTASDGHVQYSRSSDQTPVWVTAQAAMALAGKPLPLAPLQSQGAGQPPPGPSSASGALRRLASRDRARGLRLRARPNARLLAFAADAGLLTALILAPVNAD